MVQRQELRHQGEHDALLFAVGRKRLEVAQLFLSAGRHTRKVRRFVGIPNNDRAIVHIVN